jgi:hypothetical protein
LEAVEPGEGRLGRPGDRLRTAQRDDNQQINLVQNCVSGMDGIVLCPLSDGFRRTCADGDRPTSVVT